MSGPAGAAGYAGIIGGVAGHLQEMGGELTPAAMAQRKEFRKAKDRLRNGIYGFSEAQKQQAQATGTREVESQGQQQQADIARMQAAGQLAGGAATEAQRAVAREQAAGAAQVAAGVQAASNAAAQAQHANDQALVDAQADRARRFWQRQAQISMQTTQGSNIGEGSQAMGDSFQQKFNRNLTGSQPQPTSTITARGV